MPNYLVVSYDLDEQQGLYDVVDCHSEARAEEIVLRVRKDYMENRYEGTKISELPPLRPYVACELFQGDGFRFIRTPHYDAVVTDSHWESMLMTRRLDMAKFCIPAA